MFVQASLAVVWMYIHARLFKCTEPHYTVLYFYLSLILQLENVHGGLMHSGSRLLTRILSGTLRVNFEIESQMALWVFKN